MEIIQLCSMLLEIPGKECGVCLKKFCVKSSYDTMPTISTLTSTMNTFSGAATLSDPRKEEGSSKQDFLLSAGAQHILNSFSSFPVIWLVANGRSGYFYLRCQMLMLGNIIY